jgi:hypothetical protein
MSCGYRAPFFAAAGFDHAALTLDAWEYHTSVDELGAVMLADEMIDEASRRTGSGDHPGGPRSPRRRVDAHGHVHPAHPCPYISRYSPIYCK